MPLSRKITFATTAFKLGKGPREQLTLLFYAAKHGGLMRFTESELAIPLRGPAPMLHIRDNSSDAILYAEVLVVGDYAPLRELSIQPKNILDIGANIGLASLYMRRLYPAAVIHGFEPSPAEAAICERNYHSWSQATLHCCAVSDCDNKAATFATHLRRAGGQHISTEEDDQDWTHVAVTLRRIDCMIDSGLIPLPDLVKMDIEGGEVAALEGFGRYLRAPQTYILETHSAELHAQCREKLIAAGYRIHTDRPRPGTARILCMTR